MDCGISCGFHVTAFDLNASQVIHLTVFVELESGKKLFRKLQVYPVWYEEHNLIGTLKSSAFRNSLGCSSDQNEPCFLLLVVCAVIMLATLVGAGSSLTTDTTALGVIALAEMALFVYLTWVPVAFFILAILIVLSSMILMKRWAQ